VAGIKAGKDPGWIAVLLDSNTKLEAAIKAVAIISGYNSTDDLKSGTLVIQSSKPIVLLFSSGRASQTVITISRAENRAIALVARMLTPDSLYINAVGIVTATLYSKTFPFPKPSPCESVNAALEYIPGSEAINLCG